MGTEHTAWYENEEEEGGEEEKEEEMMMNKVTIYVWIRIGQRG
jgi:hypothetical protein